MKIPLLNVSIFIILIFPSCNEIEIKTVNTIDLTYIDSLATIEDQCLFLENIKEDDQEVRSLLKVSIQKFGYNSDSYQKMLLNAAKVDEQNLQKIEKYLEVHGHPTLEDHGETASSAPWLIIHHAAEGSEIRLKHFKSIYKAWKNEDINYNALSLYLNRMYKIKNGERLRWDRPFRAEEELDTLGRALDLLDAIIEVNLEYEIERENN